MRDALVMGFVLSITLATACAHDTRSRYTMKPVDVVASIVARDWRVLSAGDLRNSGLRLKRVESRDGCDGAVFLQSVENDRNAPAHAEITVTFEMDSSSPPGGGGACLERLTVVTVSIRSDSAAIACQFAELVIARLQLDVGAHPAAVRDTVAADGAYVWSVASRSDGLLHRRDLEVREEKGRWLTRFREFRGSDTSELPLRR